jgi:NADH-quinone oxidoreductase subunit N
LYGISLFYGYEGTTNFEVLHQSLSTTLPVGLTVGLVTIVTALAFKMSATPFHMWAPDVFEGAPSPVVAFFAVAPKIAALAMLARVLAGPMGSLGAQGRAMVIFLAVASMAWGALGGLAQTNVKRLMAYSSIVNIGFMLIGLATGDMGGVEAMLAYLAIYSVNTLGAFGVILCMRRKARGALHVSDLAGLAHTQPWLAMAMAIFMFSLAGVPPLAGFLGKYFVLLAAVHRGLTVLAVFGVLMSVVAAYYYLKIVKIMYFDAPSRQPLDPVPEMSLRLVTAGTALAVTLFILAPDPLLEAAKIATQGLF